MYTTTESRVRRDIDPSQPSDDPSPATETGEWNFPRSWESFLEQLHFSDPRLVAFPKLYKQFYNEQLAKEDQTIRTMMDRVLHLAQAQYSPQDAEEICRFYVFSTVLTQKNEVLSSSGRDQTVRKIEKDSEGNPQPTIKHTTEVHLEGYALGEYGVDLATAMTLKGHDLYEDCGMYAIDQKGNKTDQWIGKESLIDLIKAEFKEGEKVSHSIVAMSKYDTIPEHIQTTLQDSLLYQCLMDSVQGSEKLYHLSEEQQRDIIKSITSILRLRIEDYQRYQESGDIDEYLESITRNLFAKCIDISKNLTTGVSYYSMLRARMMATLARVLQLEVSNDIMHHLALQSHDVLFENLQNKALAEQLEKKGRIQSMNQKAEALIQEVCNISVGANTGYRISFLDEAINAQDQPVPAAQILVEVDPENFDNLLACVPELIQHPTLQVLAGSSAELSVEQYSGVLQKIMEVVGRRNRMFEIKEKVGEGRELVKLYIRVVEKKPYMWQRILQKGNGRESSPEDILFAPPLDSENAIQKFLNMQLLLFNAEYLKGKGDQIAVLIWEGGVTTCRTIQELRTLSHTLGITEEEFEFVELMDEDSKIDFAHLPEYPLYYARKLKQIPIVQ